MCKYLFKSMGGKGKVVHIDGVPAAITAQKRKKGFERAVKEIPGIEVLASQPGQYRRLPAQQVFENLMQRFPEIDAVVSANDDMAVGVVEVLAAAGRGGKTKVVGIDGITDAIQAIADGKMFATVDFSGHDQSYLAVQAAVRHLKGEKLPPSRSCCRCSSSTRTTSARSRARPRSGRCRRGTRLSARRPEPQSACGRRPASPAAGDCSIIPRGP